MKQESYSGLTASSEMDLVTETFVSICRITERAMSTFQALRNCVLENQL